MDADRKMVLELVLKDIQSRMLSSQQNAKEAEKLDTHNPNKLPLSNQGNDDNSASSDSSCSNVIKCCPKEASYEEELFYLCKYFEKARNLNGVARKKKLQESKQSSEDRKLDKLYQGHKVKAMELVNKHFSQDEDMNTESTMMLHDQILSLYDTNYNPLVTDQKKEKAETINSENNEDEDFFSTVQGMEDASASSKNISRSNNDIISEGEQSESDISSDDSADKELQKSPVKETYSPSESSEESVESKTNNDEKVEAALHKPTNNLSVRKLNKEDANRM